MPSRRRSNSAGRPRTQAAAFGQALRQRGFLLARGDRRAVVAVDLTGEVYAVARWAGIKTRDVATRIGNADAGCPPLRERQAEASCLVRDKLEGFVVNRIRSLRPGGTSRSRPAAAPWWSVTVTPGPSSIAQQEQRRAAELQARAARFRTGLRGIWDRVTGRTAQIRRLNEQETAAAETRDRAERQHLVDRQLAERQELQRDITRARFRYSREMTGLRREMEAHEPRQTSEEGKSGETRTRFTFAKQGAKPPAR